VSPVKYELGFYIPEDDILHSQCRETLKSYKATTFMTQTFITLTPHSPLKRCDSVQGGDEGNGRIRVKSLCRSILHQLISRHKATVQSPVIAGGG
jgi:hypothetical protein